jgi:hypothetical protein
MRAFGRRSTWFQELKQRALGAIDLDPRFNGFQSLAWFVGIS